MTKIKNNIKKLFVVSLISSVPIILLVLMLNISKNKENRYEDVFKNMEYGSTVYIEQDNKNLEIIITRTFDDDEKIEFTQKTENDITKFKIKQDIPQNFQMNQVKISNNKLHYLTLIEEFNNGKMSVDNFENYEKDFHNAIKVIRR